MKMDPVAKLVIAFAIAATCFFVALLWVAGPPSVIAKILLTGIAVTSMLFVVFLVKITGSRSV